MTTPVPEHLIRIRLNAHLGVEGASVTTYVDERETYHVVPLYGPFDTWEEVLGQCRAALDEQLQLW